MANERLRDVIPENTKIIFYCKASHLCVFLLRKLWDLNIRCLQKAGVEFNGPPELFETFVSNKTVH